MEQNNRLERSGEVFVDLASAIGLQADLCPSGLIGHGLLQELVLVLEVIVLLGHFLEMLDLVLVSEYCVIDLNQHFVLPGLGLVLG